MMRTQMTSIGLLVTLYGLWLFYSLASAEETNFISYKKVLRNSIRQHLDYRPKRVVIPTVSGFSSTKLIRHSSESLLLNLTVPKVQKGGIVIMATANSGYLDMLLNWKYFVDELGVTNYVVIPLDARVAQQLTYLGVPWAYDPDIGLDANPVAVRYSKNSSSVDWDNWNKVVHKKSHYFKKIIEMGFSVLVTDIDTVWLKDPLEHILDIITPKKVEKRKSKKRKDEEEEKEAVGEVDLIFADDRKNLRQKMSLCAGFFFGKSNQYSLEFINYVIQCEVQTHNKEQMCFKLWLEMQNKNEKRERDRRRPGWRLLNTTEFPSGAYLFSKNWIIAQEGGKREVPVIVHNNYLVGHETKVQRFKMFGLWRIDDASLKRTMAQFEFNPSVNSPQLLSDHAKKMKQSGFQPPPNSWLNTRESQRPSAASDSQSPLMQLEAPFGLDDSLNE